MAQSNGMGTKAISAAMQKLLSYLPRSKEINIQFLGVMPFDFFPLPSLCASSYSDSIRSASASGYHVQCCIVNTDPSTKPGKHWVAFYLGPHGKLEFFDSYGRPPTHFNFPLASNLLDSSRFEYNTLALQADTTSVCGQYCLVFLFLRCLIALQSNHTLCTSSTPLKSICSYLFTLAPTANARDKEIIPTLKKLLSLLKPRQSPYAHYLVSSAHTCFEQSCTSAFNEHTDS